MTAIRLAEFVYPAGHPLAGRAGSVYGFAVRHGGGVLLFDTGIGIGHPWVDEHYRPRVRPVLDALRAEGISPSDVTAIANSHLHFDHCGQDRALPGIPIYVQRTERAAARGEGYTIPEWVDFPGARFVEIDGPAEPAPDVRLVPTPGHTAGHQSALVRTSEGLVALAGHHEGIEDRLRALGATRIMRGHEWA